MKRAFPLEDFFCSSASFLGTARFIYQGDGEGCEHRRLIDEKRDEWCERAAMRGGPAVASTLRGGQQGRDVGAERFFGGQ